MPGAGIRQSYSHLHPKLMYAIAEDLGLDQLVIEIKNRNRFARGLFEI